MPIPSQPPRLENVIGNQADVFTIPEETPEGTSALSYKSGWPAKSATALSAGGVPPQREYFNAVNKLLSQHAFFQQSGSLYQWNNQNNYLQGAHILGSNGKEYVAKQQNGPDTSAGVQDPVQDTNGTYWTSAGSSVAAGGGGLETDENGQLYVAKLKTPRSLDGVNFDGSAPVTRFAQCSTAAGTAAKTVTISNFTLVEGATIMVLFNNTNTASNPTLNVSNTGAHPIQWRKAGVSPSWLAANRLYALTYTGSAWQIQGDLTEACIQEGGGLSVDEDGKLFVDFDSMPTDKFEAMLKSIRVPIWLEADKAFYVNQATGSDTLDTGRGESTSKPFKTIQAAANYVSNNYNVGSYAAIINICAGTYEENIMVGDFSKTTGYILLKPMSGDEGKVIIKADIGNDKDNRVFRASGGLWILRDLELVCDIDSFTSTVNRTFSVIATVDYANVDIQGCRIKWNCQDVTDANKIYARVVYAAGNSRIRFRPQDISDKHIEFHKGSTPNLLVLAAEDSATIEFVATNDDVSQVTIDAWGECHEFCHLSNKTVFNRTRGAANFGIFNVPPDKTVTGIRYNISGGAACYTQGAGEDYFPGDRAGIVDTQNYSIYD